MVRVAAGFALQGGGEKLGVVQEPSSSPTRFSAQLGVLQMLIAAAWPYMDVWGRLAKTHTFEK